MDVYDFRVYQMTDKRTPKDEPKPETTYHRPISIFVTGVRPMPDFRDLPSIVLLTVNVKLDITMQDALIDYLLENRNRQYREPVLAVELIGVKP